MPLSKVRAVAFDLDGTLYCGHSAVDGAVALVERLDRQGVAVFYLTNNSTGTRQGICDRLTRLGFPAAPAQVYSSGYGAARYLREQGIGPVYSFGSPALGEELELAGVELVPSPAQAAALLVGLDTTLDYRKLSTLLPLRDKECLLIACNRDRLFPSENGELRIGCGLAAAMVEELLERKLDLTVGKPNTYLLELLAREHGVSLEELVMVGDSLESDIAMARAAGCRSVHLTAAPKGEAELQLRSLHELGRLLP